MFFWMITRGRPEYEGRETPFLSSPTWLIVVYGPEGDYFATGRLRSDGRSKDTEAKSKVPDWGIKSTLAQG
jgi:hypothetical protein